MKSIWTSLLLSVVYFIQGYGLIDPVGHIDFYPNGGKNQPGCTKGSWINLFSHSYSRGISGIIIFVCFYTQWSLVLTLLISQLAPPIRYYSTRLSFHFIIKLSVKTQHALHVIYNKLAFVDVRNWYDLQKKYAFVCYFFYIVNGGCENEIKTLSYFYNTI